MSTRRRDLDVNEVLLYFNATLQDDGTLMVSIPGPSDSLYEDGIFYVRITLPAQYPYKSPSVGFVTKVFHPNVDEVSGSICLDVLSKTWSPMFTLKNVLESFLPQLLQDPNPSDPLNGDAAALMIQEPTQYQAKVRQYVQTYATATETSSGHDADDSYESSEDDETIFF